jgi:hypothetical protein
MALRLCPRRRYHAERPHFRRAGGDASLINACGSDPGVGRARRGSDGNHAATRSIIMKRFTILCASAALVAIGAGAFVNAAQPEGEGPSMAEMMAMMAEMGAPDAHHKTMEPMIGTFQADGTFYMGPTTEHWSGTAVNEWVLGGRFIQGDFQIPEMAGGPDFSGIAYTGYNKVSGQYESVWMDSMSTSIFMETGSYDESTKSFHFSGTQLDPMTGAEKPTRSVITIESNDRHTAKMFSTGPDGQETLDMEIVYTRK